MTLTVHRLHVRVPMRLCRVQGINVTPTFIINSVQSALLDSSTTTEAWTEFIQTLVKQGGAMA